MQANVGTLDRIVRMIVGGALIACALTGLIGPWGYLGVAPLLTGVFRGCAAYGLLGFSSCPSR